MGRHEIVEEATLVATPSAVWKVLSDPARFPKWMSHVTDVVREETMPLHIGSRFRITTRMGTHVLMSDVEVRTLEKERRLGWVHLSDVLDGEPFTMMSDGQTEFELVGEGSSTRVRSRMSFVPHGIKARLGAGYFVSQKVRPQVLESLAQLKSLVE